MSSRYGLRLRQSILRQGVPQQAHWVLLQQQYGLAQYPKDWNLRDDDLSYCCSSRDTGA